MSLIQRKPRPLKRTSGSLRDDRLFIVACDDTYAPKQYFDAFAITRIHVHVIPTIDGTSSAPYVLDRLLSIGYEEGDERWLLLDTDHCTSREHLPTFIDSIRRAKQNGVKIALSRSCFEIWLLLHHVDEAVVTPLKNARAVEKALIKKLAGYNKRKLRPEDFPLESVVAACRRAEKLDSVVTGGDIPDGNTSRVYLLWKSIVSKALRSQLPVALHPLLQEDVL
jgi:hypothetical protein